jgi:hypothetical protein
MKEQFIIMAIGFTIAGVTGFDFIAYVLKPAPKRSYFSKPVWLMGLMCLALSIYWFMNGQKL